MLEKFLQPLQPHQAKLKLFGEKAERVQGAEYDAVIEELQKDFSARFQVLRSAEQLQDKESFGDIDLICLPDEPIDETFFQNILGDRFLEHRRNGSIHSVLIKLNSGKQVHVDFIRAKDEIDLERKHMYYSKGHISSMIGMLAKKLNFKYGTEGFFKRFQDKRGNWHDILVGDSLRDGLAIMGFELEIYDDIHNIDNIVAFISGSPFFDSSYFGSENMVQRDRQSLKRNQAEDYLAQKLREKQQTRSVADEDELFRRLFPDKFRRFVEEAENIDKETYKAGAINGKKVMEVFQIKPGLDVRKILKFLSDNYPEAEELSGEIIEAVKRKVLA